MSQRESGERESQLIDTWANELETVIYDLHLRKDVLNKARRLLTRSIDLGLLSDINSATYVAFSCFCVACRMCGEHVPLDQMLKIPLWKGVKAERANRSVHTLLRDLGLRICLKCGAEGKSHEDFCQACGAWLSTNVISEEELEGCLVGRNGRAAPNQSQKYFDYYGEAPRTMSSARAVRDSELPEPAEADWFTIDNHFILRERKEMRPLFDALLSKIHEFAPDVKPSAAFSYIDLMPRSCGLYVGSHQLNIHARGKSHDPRFRQWTYNTPWGRRGEGGTIRVEWISDLDQSLMQWLRFALDRNRPADVAKSRDQQEAEPPQEQPHEVLKLVREIEPGPMHERLFAAKTAREPLRQMTPETEPTITVLKKGLVSGFQVFQVSEHDTNYLVSHGARGTWKCTCPDWKLEHRMCKHIETAQHEFEAPRSDNKEREFIDRYFINSKMRSVFDTLLDKIRRVEPGMQPRPSRGGYIDLAPDCCGLLVEDQYLVIHARAVMNDPRFRTWTFDTPWGKAGEGGMIMLQSRSDVDDAIIRWVCSALRKRNDT
jgi:hypothetical protein